MSEAFFGDGSIVEIGGNNRILRIVGKEGQSRNTSVIVLIVSHERNIVKQGGGGDPCVGAFDAITSRLRPNCDLGPFHAERTIVGKDHERVQITI